MQVVEFRTSFNCKNQLFNSFKLKVLCRDFVSSSETKFDEVYNLNSVYPISNENWQYYTQLTMISQIISNQTKCLNFKKSTILREIMREHIWTYYFSKHMLEKTILELILTCNKKDWSQKEHRHKWRHKLRPLFDIKSKVMLVDSTKDTEEPLLKCKDAFETMLNLISNL